ncbi:MAG: DUF559 domain-containing protein [Patescibacteria group bacterium]
MLTQEKREEVLFWSLENKKKMTYEEDSVWRVLKLLLHTIQINILRQVPIWHFSEEKYFILDFLIPNFGIVVEIDGSQHNSSEIEYDSKRDSFLESMGLYILRFDNEIVRSNLEEVIITIMRAILKKIDNKPKIKFYQWLKANEKKTNEILKNYKYEDWQKLKRINKNIKTINQYKRFPGKKQECYLIYKKILTKMILAL